jgi:hypothetical protein
MRSTRPAGCARRDSYVMLERAKPNALQLRRVDSFISACTKPTARR